MDNIITKDSTYAVIGYGSWATAIVKILSEKGTKVGWHIRNEEVLEGVLSEGINPKYLQNTELNISCLEPSRSIDEVVANHDVIILATPSAFLKDILSELTIPLKDKVVISAIKGIIPGDYLPVIDYLHRTYDIPLTQLGIITGPSHAEEVALGKLCYLTVVCPNIETAHLVGAKIESNYVRVSYSMDLHGVEHATILKNIYAISVGMALGIGYGDNFIAVLITNCAREMNNFIQSVFPEERDTRKAAYQGDLLVTCYSSYSRNRRLGLLMGKGFTTKAALNEMTMIAEGYYSTECMHHLNEEYKAEIPIADMVYNVLYNKASARKAMREIAKILI